MPQCVNHRRLFKPATSIMLAILLGGAVFSAMAQANVPHPRLKKEEFKHQVEQMEDAWRLAQLNGDAQAMDKLLSEDYVGITMNGQVVTKMQQLDRIRNRQLIVTKMDVDDVKVKLIGTTAVVTSLAVVEGTSDGASVRGTYRSTRVYSRSPSGVWKITNFEATRVGQPPPPSRRNGFGHDGPYQNGQDHGGPDNTPHTPPPDSTQP
jgi:ketosteroid isomerase-like protein